MTFTTNNEDFAKFMNEIFLLNNKFKAADRYYERLIWHEENFKKTLEGDFLGIKPVTVDFILNNECNYSCSGCTFNFVRKKQKHIKGKSMKKENIPTLINKLSDAGVKSLIFSGGGEPTLHPHLLYAMGHAKSKGLDIALYTNGSYQKKDLSKEIIALEPTYVRVSLNAGREMHAEFHGTKKSYYDIVIQNIHDLSMHNESGGHKTVLGTSFLINSLNSKDMDQIYSSLEDIFTTGKNLDYIAIKPEINYRDPQNQLNSDIINVMTAYVRENEDRIKEDFQTNLFYNSFFTEKIYESSDLNSPCNSHGWVANVDWQGNLSFCVEFAMDDNYILGNLVNKDFDAIWQSERRKELHTFINENIHLCPQVCRNRVKNHLIDILPLPYSGGDISSIMSKIQDYKNQTEKPNQINFL